MVGWIDMWINCLMDWEVDDDDERAKNAIIYGTSLINCFHTRNDAECKGGDDNDDENEIVMVI